MQTRTKTQATEERKKPRQQVAESQMTTSTLLGPALSDHIGRLTQQSKPGGPTVTSSNGGGAADKEEIMSDYMRIYENNN